MVSIPQYLKPWWFRRCSTNTTCDIYKVSTMKGKYNIQLKFVHWNFRNGTHCEQRNTCRFPIHILTANHLKLHAEVNYKGHQKPSTCSSVITLENFCKLGCYNLKFQTLTRQLNWDPLKYPDDKQYRENVCFLRKRTAMNKENPNLNLLHEI